MNTLASQHLTTSCRTGRTNTTKLTKNNRPNTCTLHFIQNTITGLYVSASSQCHQSWFTPYPAYKVLFNMTHTESHSFGSYHQLLPLQCQYTPCIPDIRNKVFPQLDKFFHLSSPCKEFLFYASVSDRQIYYPIIKYHLIC